MDVLETFMFEVYYCDDFVKQHTVYEISDYC